MQRLIGQWRVEILAADPALPPTPGPDDDDAEWGRPTELTFDEDGQVYGCGGVNRVRGTFVVDGDTVTFGPMAATLMAGPPAAMWREQALFAALAHPLEVRTDAPGVVELAGEGGALLRLERSDEPAVRTV